MWLVQQLSINHDSLELLLEKQVATKSWVFILLCIFCISYNLLDICSANYSFMSNLITLTAFRIWSLPISERWVTQFSTILTRWVIFLLTLSLFWLFVVFSLFLARSAPSTTPSSLSSTFATLVPAKHVALLPE